MTLFEPRPRGERRGSSARADDPFGEFRRDRRTRRLWITVVVLGALVSAGSIAVTAGGADRIAAFVAGVTPWSAPTPAPEIVALADRSFLTDEARDLFYRALPEMKTHAEIQEACFRPGEENGHTAGCFSATGMQFGAGGRMYLYAPDDERLDGSIVITAVHELLHAIYASLPAYQQARIDQLVAVEAERLAPDDPLHDQLAYSVGTDSSARGTELFAYLGTQFFPDGGFAPELEEIYARYISDRRALVDVHTASVRLIDDIFATLQGKLDQLAAKEQADAEARAHYDADRRGHELGIAQHNELVERFNALPPDQQRRYEATITRSDGYFFRITGADGFREHLAELDAEKAELDARLPRIEADEAATAQFRRELEVQRTDVLTLFEQAYPGSTVE